MKRVSTLLSAVAIVAMTAGLLAQAPNFAGKWTMDAPAAPAGGAAPGGGAPGGGGFGGRGGGGRGGWGMEATITQDATTLTVAYTQGQNPVTLTYKLDGSESKNSVMGRGGQATEQVSKATWEGARLKIVTTTPAGEQTRYVSLDGGKLKLETTSAGPNGPMTTTTTSTKQ
jgi:hypothetical protein